MDTLREHLRKAGKIGGQSRSPRKHRAALANLKKANATRLKKRAERASR